MNKCTAPWVSRFVHSDGRVTPCCFTNNTNITDIKQLFDRGQQPSTCNHCWHNEEQGNHSPRLDFNKTTGTTVKLLSINLGNYCNAECIMCNGHTSSSRNTWLKLYDISKYESMTIQTTNTGIDFTQYPDLEMLTMIGGEPALHPSTNRILDQLIESGLAKNITIGLNTNASRLDNNLRNKLLQFKDIFVTLSIDGAGDIFEYQRRPLKWNIVKSVSESWMGISSNIVINYVVTAISVWGFNDFIAWYNALSDDIKNKKPQVILTPVSSDLHYLGVEVLTANQRATWGTTAIEHPLKHELVNLLTRAVIQPAAEFKKHIAIEDQTAKKKFAEIFPDWDLDGKA